MKIHKKKESKKKQDRMKISRTEDIGNQVQWCMPAIPVFGRLRKENHEFGASLSYIEKACLIKK
jgi:hypothetical protein